MVAREQQNIDVNCLNFESSKLLYSHSDFKSSDTYPRVDTLFLQVTPIEE